MIGQRFALRMGEVIRYQAGVRLTLCIIAVAYCVYYCGSVSCTSRSALPPREVRRVSIPPPIIGAPSGDRTRVTAVKGRCLSRLTMGAFLAPALRLFTSRHPFHNTVVLSFSRFNVRLALLYVIWFPSITSQLSIAHAISCLVTQRLDAL